MKKLLARNVCLQLLGAHSLLRCNTRFKHVRRTPPAIRGCGGSRTRRLALKSQLFTPTGSTAPIALIDIPAKLREQRVKVAEWRTWARQQAEYFNKSMREHADSPSLETLFTEIDWLVDDNISFEEHNISSYAKLSSYSDEGLGRNRSLDYLSVRIPLEELSLLWARRLRERVPLQYLTHIAYWRDLELVVNADVLIPRPETELVVDWALEASARNRASGSSSSGKLEHGPWLDLGTGSGAIAIALAKYFVVEKEGIRPCVYAVDISPGACSIAAHNLMRHGVQEVVHLTQASWFDAFENNKEMQGKFAGIISNPPYIPSDKLNSLQPEVRHEPKLALDGGTGAGLDSLTKICTNAAKYLMQGGTLILETHGPEQSMILKQQLSSTSYFTHVEVRFDHFGVGRFVTAQRNDAVWH
jgi:release factor glutamine methyltransferase